MSHWYTSKDLEKLLQVSRERVYQLTRRKKHPLPHTRDHTNQARRGRHLYLFPKDAVARWIKEHRPDLPWWTSHHAHEFAKGMLHSGTIEDYCRDKHSDVSTLTPYSSKPYYGETAWMVCYHCGAAVYVTQAEFEQYCVLNNIP